MVEIKSGGDGTLSLAPSLLLSASPGAHHVAPCPMFLSNDHSSASVLAPTWPQALLVPGCRWGQGCPLCCLLPLSASLNPLHGRTLSSFYQTYHEIKLSSAGASDHLTSFQTHHYVCRPLMMPPCAYLLIPFKGFLSERHPLAFGHVLSRSEMDPTGRWEKLRWTKMGQRQKHRRESGAEVWLSESTMDGSGPGCTLLNKFKRHKQRLFSQNYSEVWFWLQVPDNKAAADIIFPRKLGGSVFICIWPFEFNAKRLNMCTLIMSGMWWSDETFSHMKSHQVTNSDLASFTVNQN